VFSDFCVGRHYRGYRWGILPGPKSYGKGLLPPPWNSCAYTGLHALLHETFLKEYPRYHGTVGCGELFTRLLVTSAPWRGYYPSRVVYVVLTKSLRPDVLRYGIS